MSLRWKAPVLALVLAAQPVAAGSSYLWLFTSAKARAYAGLARQKARQALARAAYDRARQLMASRAISEDEYETYYAIKVLADLDLEVAQLKARQASISLDLATALDQAGQKIPLCKRKRSDDEDSVTELFKKLNEPAPAPTTQAEPVSTPSGTRIEIPDPEPPPPPPDPVDPPDPPQGGATGGGAAGGATDGATDGDLPPGGGADGSGGTGAGTGGGGDGGGTGQQPPNPPTGGGGG